jgi:hypothetical protein|tara:strand:+ start:52 stop:324 length:273 start_codon:yes stop_codon:yes gene_type:complete
MTVRGDKNALLGGVMVGLGALMLFMSSKPDKAGGKDEKQHAPNTSTMKGPAPVDPSIGPIEIQPHHCPPDCKDNLTNDKIECMDCDNSQL